MGFKYITYLFLFFYVVIFNEIKGKVWKVLFLRENVFYCTTETVLLLKHGFHHRVSRELVNDQSSVSSCNQTSGSHAKQRQTGG